MDVRTDKIGTEIVIESVVALNALLVDYGEATIRSDVMNWYMINIEKEKAKVDLKQSKLNFYLNWFEYIVKTLNKYRIFFDTQLKGYSNVIIISIKNNYMNNESHCIFTSITYLAYK